MILVTGGTGFIGKALIRHLVGSGRQVRTLIRPSPHTPELPRGVPVEVAVCSLNDERGLRAAMKGVDVVIHLAGSESHGSRADLMTVDIHGTQMVAQAAFEAGVRRIFYLSHLGADRASAYPVLKAKAIAENHIRQCGVDYTILRTALVFGPNDNFTTRLALLLHAFPLFFLLPGDGRSLVQPLFIEDLVTCILWALDDPKKVNDIYQLGGPEYLSFREVVEQIMQATGTRRLPVQFSLGYLRIFTVLFEHLFPGFPVSVFWLDYLSTSHTCPLDSLPREFGLIPARFSQRLGYLKGEAWGRRAFSLLVRRRA
jgi:NADH dehydrogenase